MEAEESHLVVIVAYADGFRDDFPVIGLLVDSLLLMEQNCSSADEGFLGIFLSVCSFPWSA